MDSEFLNLLACPKCQAPVRLEAEKVVCTSSTCGLRYPIRDGIPVMLIEEAQGP